MIFDFTAALAAAAALRAKCPVRTNIIFGPDDRQTPEELETRREARRIRQRSANHRFYTKHQDTWPEQRRKYR